MLTKTLKFILIGLFTIMISACGGGSGSSDSGPAESNDASSQPDASTSDDQSGVDQQDGNEQSGTNNNADSNDNGGVGGNEDTFPRDPNESVDTDNDGIGDDTDPDDDNDGVADSEDDFPLTISEAPVNLLVSGSFEQDTRNFYYAGKNIQLDESMFGHWVSSEYKDGDEFEVYDLTNLIEFENMGRAQNAMLFQKRTQRGLIQIIDARDINTLDQQLSFSAKYYSFGQSNTQEIGAIEVIGFDDMSSVQANFKNTYRFEGEQYDELVKEKVYGSSIVDNRVVIEDGVVLNKNYQYLAVLVSGISETVLSVKEFVAVDDVFLGVHPVEQIFKEYDNQNVYDRVLDVTDEMIEMGRQEFKKECSGCHVRQDGFDLAHFSFSNFDINRRSIHHVNQEKTDSIVAYINSLNVEKVEEDVPPFFPGKVKDGKAFGEALFGEDQWDKDLTMEGLLAIDPLTVALPFDLPLWSKEGINTDWMPNKPLNESVLDSEDSAVRIALDAYNEDTTSDEALFNLLSKLFNTLKFSDTGPCQSNSPNYDVDICFDGWRWRAALAFQHDRALGLDGSRHGPVYWDVGFHGAMNQVGDELINARENWGTWLYLGFMAKPGVSLGTGYLGKGLQQRQLMYPRVGTFAILREMVSRPDGNYRAYKDLEKLVRFGHGTWLLNASYTAVDIIEKRQAIAPNIGGLSYLKYHQNALSSRYGEEADELVKRLQVLIDELESL